MADLSKNENGGWPEDEDGGFYGEPDDWFNIDDEPAVSPEEPEKTPEKSEKGEPVLTEHETEPEEELAHWTGVIHTETEPDPFFDPDLPNIAREEQKTEEEPEDIPSKKKKRRRSLNSGAFSGFKKKILLFIAVGAACAVVAFLIIYAALHQETKQEAPAEKTEPEVVVETENISVSNVRHLSFPRLSIEDSEGTLSVNEFSQILDSLYQDGCVLVDVYSIAGKDENGNFRLLGDVEVPEGKKPILISQRDVPDPGQYEYGTFAEGLALDDDGFLRSVYTDPAGNTSLGDLDVVPVLESFIRMHPDFSFEGARGIAALTGYGGLVGDSEPEAVIAAMKENGWRFASNGYKGISYGSEYTLVEQDALSWNENIKTPVGETDLIILPRKTDISSWAPYSADNPKYKLLTNLGFRFFFVHTPETPGFLQVEPGYVKEAVWEIDTLEDFTNASENGGI